MFKQVIDTSNYFFNPYAIPVMLVSVLILSIGLFVLKQNKRSIVNIAFFYECLSTGLWLFAISFVYLSRIQELSMFLYRYFTFLGVVNIMPSLILFVLSWSDEIRAKKHIFIFNLSISLMFYVLAITTDKIVSYNTRTYFWGFYPIYGPWAKYFIIIFFFQSIYGYTRLYLAYKSEKIPIKKRQIMTIFVGTILAFFASTDFIPKFFNISLYPGGYIFMFIFISLVAYSIVRYRAFDIETVIHKTVMWLFTFSFIIIPVSLLYRWVLPYIRESKLLETGFWIIGFLLLAIYLRAIQPKIDHFFQRRQSNLERISNRFTEELVHLKGLNQLIQRIEDTITDTLYPQRTDIFIYNEAGGNYELANPTSPREITELKGEEPFLRWLAKNNKIAYREFIDIDPAYALIREKAKDYFNLTETIVTIPLVLNEKLLGIINLDKKANLRHYTAADFQFLTMLKNQSTIAISNSLLYENIEEQVRQRTKELLGVQKQLIQAEKLATVGTLAGGVAHEINNPLTAILTNVQMLLASNPADAALDRESLELIEEATKRCRTIVQKLMAYAKKPLETSEVSEVDLLSVLKNVIAFLKYQLEQENIRIITDAKEEAYPVTGNHNELEQVVTNIILNARDAIKQTKKSGAISVSLLKDDDWVKIKIQDEGIGIPQEIISKVFDPFFTTKDVGKGTGLGLSICQAIVEKHNGLITVKSEVNKGSIFTVQLPKTKETSVIKG